MSDAILVFIGIATAFQLVVILVFIANSNTQQLKNRVPDLSIFAGLTSLVQFVVALLLITDQDLCTFAYWIAHLYVPCCSLPLILRSWTVYFAWHYNEAKLCRAMKLETNDKMPHSLFFKPTYNWFLRHPSMLHRKTRYGIMLIFIVFHGLLGLAFRVNQNDICYVFNDLIHFEVIFIIYFIVNAFMIRLLFTVSTSLGIFKELLCSTLCWAIIHSTYFILRYNHVVWSDGIISLLIFLLNFISFGWPLYEILTTKLGLRRQSLTAEASGEDLKKTRSRQSTKYVNSNVPLRDCLHDIGGIREFKAFLAKEFSVENILFWEKVEEFKKTFNSNSTRDREAMANIILDEYIAEYATSPINVDYKSIKVLREDIRNKKISYEMFDKVQNLLYHLMATDSYRRFLLTPAGKRYRFFSVQ